MTQIFQNLRVYNDAYALSVTVAKRLGSRPLSDRVRNQLIGSTSAVCANLAEMCAFENVNQMRQKVITCIAEANESAYWLTYCGDTGILDKAEVQQLLEQNASIARQLTGLKKALGRNPLSPESKQRT